MHKTKISATNAAFDFGITLTTNTPPFDCDIFSCGESRIVLHAYYNVGGGGYVSRISLA